METAETLVAREAASKDLRQVEIKQVSDWEDEIVARLSALAGEKAAAIRGVRRQFSQQLAKSSPELIIRLALRLVRRKETVSRYPESVRQFLTQHENELAARVSREVNNKLVTGLKNSRRRDASVNPRV